ncbi:hypothetical protein ScPMuIL_016239 [Solemya velum]
MALEGTPLYKAVIEGQTSQLRKLLDSDANPSVRDSKGRCLLHVAAQAKAEPDILKELLAYIDPTIRDTEGNTVADIVKANKQTDMEKVLKSHMKGIVLDTNIGKLEKMLLSGWDMWPVAQEDIQKSEEKKKFLTNIPDFQKRVTKLHCAIQEGNLLEVKKLADNKLVHAADGTGLPPLHKAIILGHADIVLDLMKSFRESLKLTDNMGRSALHYAGGCHDAGYLYMELISEGADDTVTDLAGKTPKDYFDNPEELSVMKERQRIVEILEILEKKRQSAKKDEIPQTNVYKNPQPSTLDGIYVSQHLGSALTLALADVAEHRPWDPIEYLAQWLYQYKETLNFLQKEEEMLKEIQREELARQKEIEDRRQRKREEKLIHDEEIRKEKEIEEEEKRKEQEELQKKSKDAAFARRPSLETVKEEGEEDSTAKEKDENGQTELHKLAAQEGTDLSALIRLGYSIADRDANNRTARDIASAHNITDNVTAIDNHVRSMIEGDDIDGLKQLVLDGYDSLQLVIDNIDRETQSEDVQLSLETIQTFKNKIDEISHTVQLGSVRDVQSVLTRKKLVEAKDKHGRCSLHIAILSGKEDVVEYLAKTYPNSLKCRDNMNRTPLHYAMGVSQSMADLMISLGADQNAKDVKQRTPSYYSSSQEDILSLQQTLPSVSDQEPEPELKQEPGTSQENLDEPQQTEEDQPPPQGEQTEQSTAN